MLPIYTCARTYTYICAYIFYIAHARAIVKISPRLASGSLRRRRVTLRNSAVSSSWRLRASRQIRIAVRGSIFEIE